MQNNARNEFATSGLSQVSEILKYNEVTQVSLLAGMPRTIRVHMKLNG